MNTSLSETALFNRLEKTANSMTTAKRLIDRGKNAFGDISGKNVNTAVQREKGLWSNPGETTVGDFSKKLSNYQRAKEDSVVARDAARRSAVLTGGAGLAGGTALKALARRRSKAVTPEAGALSNAPETLSNAVENNIGADVAPSNRRRNALLAGGAGLAGGATLMTGANALRDREEQVASEQDMIGGLAKIGARRWL